MREVEDAASEPNREYQRRLAARRKVAARLAQRERSIGNVRLLVFTVGLVLAWLAWGAELLSAAWLLVPVTVFAGLVVVHARVIDDRKRAERSVQFYERGLGRLEERWAGAGERGERFVDDQHPYGRDLDLFGEGSLYELLCTARTQSGEETLADWLRAPANPVVVRARQEAVAELRPCLDLREEMALLGSEVRSGVNARSLIAWAEMAPTLPSPRARVAAALLVALTAISLGLWQAAWWGPLPMLALLAAEGTFGWWYRSRVLRVIRAVDRPDHDLVLLSELLGRLETERFASARLVALRAELISGDEPAARCITKLHRLVHLLDARKNELFAPVSALLLWGTQLAFAIESWRASYGSRVAGWLAAVGEIEALGALASHAFEHPADPFPSVVESGPCFEAEALGHPLLPERRCVRNDVILGGETQVWIVSGSNMSGKSTLLRTVGVNTVLALAGAPVRAQRLRLSPLAIGGSLRIQDSLQRGTSHFYAEITRLRQIVQIAEGRIPLLFLLDEILSGTNSHDRRIGAEAVVRGLVERGAVGFITTHDLALARIADELAPRVLNVHFEDHLENGRMSFDYRLRPGVVRKSNALELMRAVGLPV